MAFHAVAAINAWWYDKRVSTGKVLCTGCGFFSRKRPGGPLQEMTPDQRREFQAARLTGEYEDRQGLLWIVECGRGEWRFRGTSPATLDPGPPLVAEKAIVLPRKCSGYFGYQPGRSPDAHKELLREHEVTRWKRMTVAAGVGGAVLGAAGSFLYFFLTTG